MNVGPKMKKINFRLKLIINDDNNNKNNQIF